MLSWPSKDMQTDCSTVPLVLGYQMINLFIQQIRVRLIHGAGTLGESQGQQKVMEADQKVLSPEKIDVMTVCLKAIHEVLQTFLSFSVEDIRTIPSFHFVRIAYAVVYLLRLHCSVIKPESQLGKAMPKEYMQVDSHLTQFLYLLQAAAADEKSKLAHSFQSALKVVKVYFDHQKDTVRVQGGSSTEGVSPTQRLEAQPVDAGRNTPSLGYKRIALPEGKGSRHPSPAEHRKTRSSSFHNLPPQDDVSIQTPVPQPMGNTPLHLLSEVATIGNPPSSHHMSPAHMSPASQHSDGWQYNGHAHYPPQMVPPPHSVPIPYSTEPPVYYPHPTSHPGPGYAHPAEAYNGMVDPGLEQAMGMAFGEEPELSNMLMDEGYFNVIHQTTGVAGVAGVAQGWEMGAGCG